MQMPELKDSYLTVEDRVALLTFNRDDVRNVLTGTGLIDDIENVVEWINGNADISVLVLTGAGKAFSAGGNLKEMSGRNTTHNAGPYSGSCQEVSRKYREGIQRIPRALDRLNVPSLAAVNGAAIGAGFDLALMCDLTLAAQNAQMGETFLNLGIIPGVGGAYWLTNRVGPQRAAELVYTGRVFGAQDALEMGLILEVTTQENLLNRTLDLAKSIGSKPPLAIRYGRRLLQHALEKDLDSHLRLCAELQGECHNQSDHLEAVNAFLEKREPKFTGS